MRIILAISAFLLILGGTLRAQQNNVTLNGRVVDSSGASVQHATVIVYRWNSETQPAVLREVAKFNTDMFGEFSGLVAPGKYDVLISSNFFVPQARLIRVISQPQKISVTLNQDPDLPREECCSATVPTVEVEPEH